MPLYRALLLLLLCVSASVGAELRTLDGKTITGDLIRLSEKEVVLKSGTDEVTTPIAQVLTLDLAPAANLMARDAKYTDVELTDGSVLHCSRVLLKSKEAELTLLSGQEVKMPLTAVAYVMSDAQDAQVAQVFKGFLTKKRSRDILVAKTGGQLNGLEGTLGDADEKGETIEFDLAGANQKVKLALSKVQGLIFLRPPDATQPLPICKVQDNYRNTVLASALALSPTGLTVTTPAGAKIEYTPQLAARLDFSQGKLTFLSDLTPARVVETNNLDRVEHYRRDQNLDGEKLCLDNKKYDKGLALHAYTELEYKLDGEYQFFAAVIGVDDLVGGSDGATIVRIEGDNRELKTCTVNRKDKPIPIKIPVKDVHRLKIVVSSGDLLDLGKHVNLADAKVSK